jgi:NitT/TauT family transport system substrate-binding protein
MHHTPIRRRFIAAAVATGAVALSLSACGGSGAGAGASGSGSGSGSKSLSFGTQPVIAYGMFQVAQDKGYYKKQGVSVKLVSFDSGSPELEAMAGGSIQAGTMGATPVLTAAGQGLIKDLKIISLTDNPSGGYSILADPSIKSVADLKGKKIAGTAGSNYQYFLNRALAKYGLSENDVEFINAEPPDAQAAFLARRVDAIVPPESARFLIPEKRPDTKVLFTAADFTKGPGATDPFDVYDVIVAPGSVVKDRTDVLASFLAAFHGDTVRQLNDDPTGTYTAITNWLNSAGQAGVKQDAVQNQFKLSTFYGPAEVRKLMKSDRVVKSLQQQFEFLVKAGKASGELDARSLIDTTVIDRVVQQS